MAAVQGFGLSDKAQARGGGSVCPRRHWAACVHVCLVQPCGPCARLSRIRCLLSHCPAATRSPAGCLPVCLSAWLPGVSGRLFGPRHACGALPSSRGPRAWMGVGHCLPASEPTGPVFGPGPWLPVAGQARSPNGVGRAGAVNGYLVPGRRPGPNISQIVPPCGGSVSVPSSKYASSDPQPALPRPCPTRFPLPTASQHRPHHHLSNPPSTSCARETPSSRPRALLLSSFIPFFHLSTVLCLPFSFIAQQEL